MRVLYLIIGFSITLHIAEYSTIINITREQRLDTMQFKYGERYEKCAEQQRLLFLGMCSLEDRKRICDEKIMDLYNFERITYLLEAFGFEEYKFVFEMKYKDLLLKLADIVEQNLVCGNSMDKYVLQDKYEIRNEWQQEFVRNLPNEVMKNCIQEIFDLYA